MGIIERAGTWYSYGESRIGQGRENAKDFLKKHPDIIKEIESKIFAQVALKKGEA